MFNIGSGHGRSLLDIVRAIERQLGRPVEVVHKPGRAVDVPRNVLDIARARSVLGWAPKTPFDVGLMRTVEWLREQYAR